MTRTRHIVIVDDEPNIGRSLRLILEGEGYRVTVCESAAKFHAERRRSRLPARVSGVARLGGRRATQQQRQTHERDGTRPGAAAIGRLVRNHPDGRPGERGGDCTRAAASSDSPATAQLPGRAGVASSGSSSDGSRK